MSSNSRKQKKLAFSKKTWYTTLEIRITMVYSMAKGEKNEEKYSS